MRTTSPPPTPSTRRFWRQRRTTMIATAGLTASTNASSSKLHQIPYMTQVWQALPIRMFGLYVYWVWEVFLRPSEIFTPRQTHVTHPFSHPLPRECQNSELAVAIRSEYSQCSALSLVCCLLRLIFFRSRKSSLKSPSTPNMHQHSICDNFRVIK